METWHQQNTRNRPSLKKRLKTKVRSFKRRTIRTATTRWRSFTGTGTVATARRRKSGGATVREHTRNGRVVRSHTRHS